MIIVATWLTVLVASKVLPYFADRGPSQFHLCLLGAVPIIRLMLLNTSALWVVPMTLQSFLVIAGAASLAIRFAFKNYVSTLIAGIVAIIERPYRPGD